MRIKKTYLTIAGLLLGLVLLTTVAYAFSISANSINSNANSVGVAATPLAGCGARPAGCNGACNSPGQMCCWQGSGGACQASCQGDDYCTGGCEWGPRVNCGSGSKCTSSGAGGECEDWSTEHEFQMHFAD